MYNNALLALTARLFGVLTFLLFSTLSISAYSAAVSGQGTWETTLLARDLDGNTSTIEAYYDTVQDITWLADADYAWTSGFDTDGLMTWEIANAWAADLTLGGYLDWRLPNTFDVGSDGCNYSYDGTDCGYNVDTSTSEMAYMFYEILANIARVDTQAIINQTGWGLSNTGPFINLRWNEYWSATQDVSNTFRDWYFGFDHGDQGTFVNNYSHNAWAIHDGDIGTAVVPLPAAAWLFISAMLGMFSLKLRSGPPKSL